MLRDMLYAYLRDHDVVLSYDLSHLFFNMLREVCPEEIVAMPYAYAPHSLALVKHWDEPFDENRL